MFTALFFTYAVHVDRVIDGDTVVVDIDLGFSLNLDDQRLRLLGIDAPEKTGLTKVAGLASQAEMIRLLGQGTPHILSQGAPPQEDNFGRWLVKIEVTRLDGTHFDVGAQMIQNGYAVPYP